MTAEAGPDATLDSTVGDALEAGLDQAVAEAGPDATIVDAAPDVSPDASGDAGSCIAKIFGDHYLRTDGKLFYAANGLHTLVIDAATSAPLVGVTELVQQGNDHACGLRNDGTVWCWSLTSGGGNTNGDLGNGVVGGTTFAVGAATQVVTDAADAGAPVYLTSVSHLSTPSGVLGTFPTCAIRSDKTVWCWGDSAAQVGSNDGLFWGTTGSVAGVPYAIPIAAAPAGGGPPPTLHADQVSIGARHACLLLSGSVSCWGQNIAGNLADGDSTLAFKAYPTPIVSGLGLPATVDSIGSGYDYSCALAGGSVWCWGSNYWGQIGNPSVPPSICNANYCKPTPTPVQASAPDGGTTLVPDAGTDQNPLSGMASLVVGYEFGCGVDSAGTMWCWGADNAGLTLLAVATPYTSTTLPYSNVTALTVIGTAINGSLRYTTASGAYISGNHQYTPYCL